MIYYQKKQRDDGVTDPEACAVCGDCRHLVNRCDLIHKPMGAYWCGWYCVWVYPSTAACSKITEPVRKAADPIMQNEEDDIDWAEVEKLRPTKKLQPLKAAKEWNDTKPGRNRKEKSRRRSPWLPCHYGFVDSIRRCSLCAFSKNGQYVGSRVSRWKCIKHNYAIVAGHNGCDDFEKKDESHDNA